MAFRQEASSGGGWFLHSRCILDGLQPTDTVIGADGVSEEERLELQELHVTMPMETESSAVEPPPPLPLDVDDADYDVAKAVEEQRVQATEEAVMNKGD